jgi:hypothetical protein
MLMQMEMMVITNSHCTILYFGIAITIIAHMKVQSSNLNSWWGKGITLGALAFFLLLFWYLVS